jgi:uracil phosphoribosyltransferase
LRDRNTKTEDFRQAMDKLGLLLAVEASLNLPTEIDTVITPLDIEARCSYVDDSKILLIPILRAGLGFVDSFVDVLSAAKVAHIGIARDHETLEARAYLDTVPEHPEDFDHVFILDPMLATGNSSVRRSNLFSARAIRRANYLCLCPFHHGRHSAIAKQIPELSIITAANDPELNEKAYIVPGLGDAGDRLNLL